MILMLAIRCCVRIGACRPELPVLGVTVRDVLDDGAAVDDGAEVELTAHQWAKVQQSEAYKRDPAHRLVGADPAVFVL